jgi:hypothetical protein
MISGPRHNDEDLKNLYCGYRSQEFQKMCYDSGSWSTPGFNVDFASPRSCGTRRELIAAMEAE